jgi:hypothetical protein
MDCSLGCWVVVEDVPSPMLSGSPEQSGYNVLVVALFSQSRFEGLSSLPSSRLAELGCVSLSRILSAFCAKICLSARPVAGSKTGLRLEARSMVCTSAGTKLVAPSAWGDKGWFIVGSSLDQKMCLWPVLRQRKRDVLSGC